MLGTFEAEKESKITYGLVDQPQFWNPVKHQVDLQNIMSIFFVHFYY